MTKDELARERLKLKTEAEVESEVRKYLLSTRRPYSKTDAAKSFNVRGQQIQRVRIGWPDYVTMTKFGRFFAVEIKRAIGGTLSREQALMLQRIHEWGGLICIARSVECVIESETFGTRQKDLDEIAKAIAKPIKSPFKNKPIDPLTGF